MKGCAMAGHIRKLSLGWSLLVVATLMSVGCAGSMGRRPAIAAKGEPGLGDSTVVAIDPAPPRTLTWADRHPALSKPREVYDSTQGNKFIKTAAGTFIGVPKGIGGEIKQIFVGQPKVATYP
jgi:hypothetical protein